MPKDWYRLGEVFAENDIVGSGGADIGNFYLDGHDDDYSGTVEQTFAAELKRHLVSDHQHQLKVEADTIAGRIYLNFVIERNGQRIALEISDGAIVESEADEWKDAMLLGGEFVHLIYRFNRRDIIQYQHECILLISCWHPEFFSPRGLQRLQGIASPSIMEYAANTAAHSKSFHTISLLDNLEARDREYISVERNSVSKTGLSGRPRWRDLYEFAQRHGGGDIETLRQLYYGPKQ